jgi:arginyl-tRNA synthetase
MKQTIIDFLHKKTSLEKQKIEETLEVPPSSEMGDFAFPCFILSKTLKKPPIEIALEISRELNKKLPKEISKVESKGPYLNFFLDKTHFTKEILTHALKKDYGSSKKGEKILVEHTSVNPNASPHVGRARNSIIGDSIVRILKFQGNKVETHYYINDVSKQIAMLALNFKEKDTFDDLLQKYIEISKKIQDTPGLEKKVFSLLEKFEHKDPSTTKLFNKIVDKAIKGQKKIFKQFGIEFDYFDYESKYIGKTSQDLLKKFEKTGKLFKDKEGRWVLDQSLTPLIKKMKAPYFVLARSNGTGLYGLRDIAYTLEKMNHGKNIIILGEDQKLYFEQISEALKLLGFQSPDVVHYSFVLLQTEKGATKMSTRRGELVLLEQFFEETIKKAKQEIEKRSTKGDAKKIAVGAIKYAMLRNDNEKNIIFSWEQSLNFEGDSGPYLQYSYARASSIIKKAKSKNKFSIPQTITDEEYSLIKKVSEFPEVVQQAGRKFSPSLIANYSFQLAKTFNEFYHSSQVIDSAEEEFRLKLVDAFRNTIKNSLYLLGIDVMEEM